MTTCLREARLEVKSALMTLVIEAGQARHFWRERLWMAGWSHWPVQRSLREETPGE